MTRAQLFPSGGSLERHQIPPGLEKDSQTLDLSREARADTSTFNDITWHAVKWRDILMPAPTTAVNVEVLIVLLCLGCTLRRNVAVQDASAEAAIPDSAPTPI